MSGRTQLFKFLMVRPPQKRDSYASNNHFFRYSDNADNTFSLAKQIGEAVRGGEPLTQVADRLSKLFMDSESFIAGYSSLKESNFQEDLRIIARCYRILSRQNNGDVTGRTIEELEDVLGTKIGTYIKRGKLRELKDVLWSSLGAAYIQHHKTPIDLGQLCNAVRIIHILETFLTKEVSNVDIASLIRAKPVLPKFGRIKAPDKTPEPTGSREDPRVKELQSIGARLNEYKKIRGEVTAAYTDQRRKRRVKGVSVVPRIRKIKSVDPESGEEITRIDVSDPTDVGNSRILSKEAKKNITNKSIASAAKVGISVDYDTYDEIVSRLDQLSRELTTKARSLSNPVKGFTSRIGSTIISSTVSSSLTATPWFGALDPNFANPFGVDPYYKDFDGTKGTVRPLGIGDLEIVTETLKCYHMTDISHVENIMKSEWKKREYRTLNRTENTYISSTETTQLASTDLQTSERFELQAEVQNSIEAQSSLSLGASVSASYGPVSVSTDANYSTSNSTSESTSTSSTYAQEIVENTVESIQEKVKEKQISKVVNEVEETNLHDFNNQADSANHIRGIYRFLEKEYLCELFRYDQRMMFEFMVPEPAAFYIHSKKNIPLDGITLSPPKDDILNKTPTQIRPGNYQDYVALYQVEGINPPPPRTKTIGWAYDNREEEDPTGLNKNQDFKLSTKADNTIEIPAGYEATEAWVNSSYTSYQSLFKHANIIDPWSLDVWIGRQGFSKTEDNSETSKMLDGETGKIAISIKTQNVAAYAMSIEIECTRTDALIDAWKLETYNSILNAYKKQQISYEAQVRSAELNVDADVSGKSPALNKKIVQDELQKDCITLLTDQYFSHFDAKKDTTQGMGYPEIDVEEAMDEGDYIKFFQHAFEWEQMTYVFYPYFWGKKKNWVETSQYDDTDPKFTDFLKAGAARVIVPVRPKFDAAVTYFQSTGKIWQGGEAPTIDDELYLSIIAELQAQQGVGYNLEDKTPDETWSIRVPTNLVYLQADEALPCDHDEES